MQHQGSTSHIAHADKILERLDKIILTSFVDWRSNLYVHMPCLASIFQNRGMDTILVQGPYFPENIGNPLLAKDKVKHGLSCAENIIAVYTEVSINILTERNLFKIYCQPDDHFKRRNWISYSHLCFALCPCIFFECHLCFAFCPWSYSHRVLKGCFLVANFANASP